MHIKIKEEEDEGRIIITSARGCQAMCVIVPDTNQPQKGAWAEVDKCSLDFFSTRYSVSHTQRQRQKQNISTILWGRTGKEGNPCQRENRGLKMGFVTVRSKKKQRGR